MRSAVVAITPLLLTAEILLCGCQSKPVEPERVSEVEPAIEPKVRPERTGPFRNPNAKPPKVRRGAQLDPEALTALMTKAKQHADDGRLAIAVETLNRCANRVPQSVVCEGELALLLFTHGTRLAEAKYYLDEAAMASPPIPDLDLYRRMGHMGVARARFDAARSALAVVTQDETATSNDFVAFARSLRHDVNRLEESAEAYQRAYTLNPKDHELLEDRATLYERSGDYARAAELLEQYTKATEAQGRKKEILEKRVQRLEAKAEPEAKVEAAGPPEAKEKKARDVRE